MRAMSFARVAAFAAALFAFTASPLRADAPPASDGSHFTSRGRRLVSGNITGGYSDVTQAGGTPGPSWWLSVSPGLLYFFRENLGLGGFTSVTLAQTTRGDTKNLTGGVGVRGLYDWRIADRLSLLFIPQAAFTWLRSDTNDDSTSARGLELSLVMPLTYHASSSVALGIGPFVSALRLFSAQNRSDFDDTVSPTGGRLVGITSYIGYSF